MSMNNDVLEELFSKLENSFDVAEPQQGHKERFMEKLQNKGAQTKNKFWYWKPLSIAASFLILIALGLQLNKSSSPDENSEVAKTQFYFASLLDEEIEKLNTVATKDTKMIVDDAMHQLAKLQEDYVLLEQELKKTGDTKKILYAMVVNFQTRINLLQEVIEKIEETKKIKTLYTYEDKSI
jgi:hypothetical protein